MLDVQCQRLGRIWIAPARTLSTITAIWRSVRPRLESLNLQASFRFCALINFFSRTGLSTLMMLFTILERFLSLETVSDIALADLMPCLGAMLCQDHPYHSSNNVTLILPWILIAECYAIENLICSTPSGLHGETPFLLSWGAECCPACPFSRSHRSTFGRVPYCTRFM